MSAYPTTPTDAGSRDAVSSADNDNLATFKTAVSAMECKGKSLILLQSSFSAAAADTASLRVCLYNDADDYQLMIDAQTATARAQTVSGRYQADALTFPTYGYSYFRIYVDSVSAGNVTVEARTA